MIRVGSLVRADWRNVVRDPLLLLVIVVPLLFAAIVRVGFPWAAALAEPRVALDPYALFVIGYLLVQTPMLVGGAAGFMLLDEREAQVLAAIAVTPLGKRGWLAYRVAVPVAAGVVMGAAAVYVTGLEPPAVGRFLVIVILAAFEAPLATLFLAAFAANKVQAMALAKAGTLVVLAPFAALFVAPPWQYVAGALPQFWVVKLALASEAGVLEFSMLVIVALAVHGLALWGLAVAYNRRPD
jgi:fluoroquinolone transport system permease protein